MLERPNSTDLLLQDLIEVLLDSKAYAYADMLQGDANAGEYAAGFDYAMLAFKDLGLIPDAQLIIGVLDSPWCEKDSYAEVISHELLAKDAVESQKMTFEDLVDWYDRTRSPW